MKKVQRFLVATGFGLLASGAMFAYVNGNNQRADAGEPQAPVLIAKTAIDPNLSITPDQVSVESRPKRFIPDGALANPDLAVGRVPKIDVATGEPILESQLYVRGHEAETILPVPEGMRAVTVAVDEVVGVAGFVQPGMVVDVITTMDVGGAPITKFLLQKVQVLACAQDAKRKDDPEAKVVSSATLAVAPSDAERLILAADRGKIRLAMRDPKDPTVGPISGATPETILGAPKRAAKVASRPRRVQVVVRPAPSAPSIMIIRGTATEMVTR